MPDATREALHVPCRICGAQQIRYYCRKEQTDYYACRNCSLIFQYPPPSAESMAAYVDTEYERGLYREYVEARDMKIHHFRYRLEQMTPRVKKGRLLDVGCSCGYFLEVAAAQGYDVHGLELSKTAIAAAHPAVHSRIIQSNINDLSSEHDGRYDLITAFDLIEHLDQPKDFLRRAGRLLTRKGSLVLTTPDAEHFLRYLMGSRWPMLQPMQHLSILSRRALQIALEETGFTDIFLDGAHKTITYEYLFKQVRPLNPLLYSGLRAVGRILPRTVMRKYRHVNIGELFVVATKRD